LREVEALYFWKSKEEIEDYEECKRQRRGKNKTLAR
jgi:hypothetical protein